MKVITLDNNEFVEACRRLGALVEDSGYCPDIIVAIATGGVFVSLVLAEDRNIQVSEVDMRRPSTGLKKKLLAGVIASMPRGMANVMRIVEAKVLGLFSSAKAYSPRNVVLSKWIRTRGREKRILIVDDAVDSGVTLRSVKEALEAALPSAELRTAVIARTSRRTFITPDYVVYDNCGLVRFPWSLDYSEKQCHARQ